jgi:membrane-associated phospholipid phosphatase
MADHRHLLSYSYCLGITRITDNRHHPTDVLAGGVLGSVIAIVAVRS